MTQTCGNENKMSGNSQSKSHGDFTEIPIGYFQRFDQLLKERGLGLSALFNELSLDLNIDSFHDELIEIRIDQLKDLFRLAIQHANDPSLGFYLGTRMPVTTHGILGYAAMSGQNLRQSLQTIVRYLKTVNQLIRLTLIEKQGLAILQLDDNYCFHSSRHIFHEIFTSALLCIFNVLTDKQFACGELFFAYPEPGHAESYKALFECPVHFNATETRFQFSVTLLDLPLIFADKNAHAMASGQCEQKLKVLSQSESLATQVRDILLNAKGQYPTADEIAVLLNLTQRTFRRRLASEQSSFTEILCDVRRQHALEYMQMKHLKFCEIAYLLGYSDQNNFCRAFKKWTRMTPAEYRANSL